MADNNLIIVSSRIFEAPIEFVFKAWANPTHLQNWWGPEGFTNTFETFDFRQGGKWKFVMHGPDKGNYKNECEFEEIIEPTYISWKRISQPLFRVEVVLGKLNTTQTKVDFKMLFATAEECLKLKPYVIPKNEENFDKLEKELLLMR